MRVLCPVSAVVLLLLASCSVPELEERELKITMAEARKETNDSVRVQSAGVVPKDSSFREYDAKMIGRIEKRWLELTPLIQLRGAGQVVVDFRLSPDGQVTNVQVRPTRLLGFAVEICKQAVLDSAPFDPWPAEMRPWSERPVETWCSRLIIRRTGRRPKPGLRTGHKSRRMA